MPRPRKIDYPDGVTRYEAKRIRLEQHLKAGGTRREFLLDADAEEALALIRRRLGCKTATDAVIAAITNQARLLEATEAA